MSNRQPSTPPPMENEQANPFFTTPQVKAHSKTPSNIDTITSQHNYHHRKNSTGSTTSSSNAKTSNIKNKPNSLLFTPQTPYVNNNNDGYSHLLPLSPQTSTKKNQPIEIFNRQREQYHQQQQQLQQQTPSNISHINPLRTPETTPRHVTRKRDVNDLSFIQNTGTGDHVKLGHPIFQTTPSTVGSGRNSNFKKTTYPLPNNSANKDKTNLLEFRSAIKIQVEQDENENSDLDVEMKDSTLSSIKKRFDVLNSDYENEKERMLMNYTSSECDSDEDAKQPTESLRRRLNITSEFISNEKKLNIVKTPVTPPRQIMNDSFIFEKFGIEKCKYTDISSDDLEEIERDLKNRKNFSNPFQLSEIPSKVKTNFSPRYENEIEMVYHATGEKFFVPLSEDGKRIKPKKLNFDAFKRSNEISHDDLLQTPPRSSNNNKMSIKGLLNDENERFFEDEDDYDDNEDVVNGVKRKRIVNPFKGTSQIQKGKLGKCENVTGNENMQQIEYLNQTTGKHLIEEMDEDQLRIKPKKLDFSEC